MRLSRISSLLGTASLIVTGCATTPRESAPLASTAGVAVPRPATRPTSGNSPVVPAAYQATEAEPTQPVAPTDSTPVQPMGLSELVGLTLERNPRLAQVGWAVETARGQAIQAGLYPNPVFSFSGDELGDRTGPTGILTAMASQELVTANKLGLSRAAALKAVDQATLDVVSERYQVLTNVRQAFYELAALERRAEILAELVKLAEQSTQNAEKLLKAKEAARIDVVQLEVDRERYRAEYEATLQALPAARRKLAASVGVQELSFSTLQAEFENLPPDLELDRIREYVLNVHPELKSAQIGVEKARLVLARASVEPIPNLTVNSGYTRQGQNRSNDWNLGVTLPLPGWNKNQGNIFAAKAQINEATNNVGRVQNELVTRLANSYASYTSARKRAERYRLAILPRAQETYELSLKAYQGGQFEYLRVLAAQQTVAEANLERVKALAEMWQAASQIAGLMLEDHWPNFPTPEKTQP